ncbi:hypothetical protein ACFY94_33705 [Streptomyces griseorubiginosus]|uniref:hypothetical protein n=1 Tax=Streptomyces griseorubiginosus TaxID=67304 RepID=UPI0036EF2C35
MLVGISAASADDPPQLPGSSKPPAAVEDYDYPGAGKILTEKGIKLKKGDGRILLADCDPSTPQIRVLTVGDPAANRADTYCFTALGATGHLTLELPRVFGLETADHPISADLTSGGQSTSVDVGKNDWKSVGEGTTNGTRSVLVELRVTG